MTRRWAVVCRDVDGQEHARHPFRLRWTADRFARSLGGYFSLDQLQMSRDVFGAQVELYGAGAVLDRVGVPRMFTVERRGPGGCSPTHRPPR